MENQGKVFSIQLLAQISFTVICNLCFQVKLEEEKAQKY